MAAKVAIHPPSLLLFPLALMLSPYVTQPYDWSIRKSVNMTLRVVRLEVNGTGYKAINVTCEFNKTIPEVVAMGLDRVARRNGRLQEKVMEAKAELEDGALKIAKNFVYEGPLYRFNGSFQDRWFSFYLANFTEADFGEYTCYMIYQVPPTNAWQSVSDLRIVRSYEYYDDIEVRAQKEFDRLQHNSDTKQWAIANLNLGAFVIGCTLCLAVLAVMTEREYKELMLRRQAAAAAAAAASNAPEPPLEAAATGTSLGSAAASRHSVESLAPTAALPAVLAAGTVGLAEADLAAASSDVSRMPSPEPSPLESQSAPAVLETVPSVALEMVPLTLEERPPTPTGGQSESLL